MMVAVETSLRFDDAAEYERQLTVVDAMGRELRRIPGIIVETAVPAAEAREPYIEVRWDSGDYDISPAGMRQALRAGEPSIEVRALFLSGGQLHLTAVLLKDGEAEIVTQRVAEILQGHATRTGA